MEEIYETGRKFNGGNCPLPLPKGEYEDCVFSHLNFSNGDLSGMRFVDCVFEHCDLSLAKINKTAFRVVLFSDCKMLGLRFDQCHTFGLDVRFERSLIHHAVFFGLTLKKTLFTDCELKETDFTEADLGAATFDRCDLAGATFHQTNLEKADFRTAVNYALDPETNKIKKARFSVPGIAGLLSKYGIMIDL